MTRLGIALMVGLIAWPAAVRPRAAAGSPLDDDFTITGCLTESRAPTVVAPSTLVWTRSDIMLAAAEARPDAVPMTGRVFYWLDDDEDLGKYRGRRVEIKGELEDFEKGKVELDRHKDYTKVKLSLKGHTEEAKVPTAWLNPDAGHHDEEFQIVARRIDVKKVKVLGSCYGSE